MANSTVYFPSIQGRRVAFPKQILFQTQVGYEDHWKRGSDWFDKVAHIISFSTSHFPTSDLLKFSHIMSAVNAERELRSKIVYVALSDRKICAGFSSPYLWKEHGTMMELCIYMDGQLCASEHSVEEAIQFYEDGVVGDHENLLPLIRSYLACKDRKSYDKWSKEFEHIGD